MLYSLEYLHHGLEEKDFEQQFTPQQITDRFPDVHPLLPAAHQQDVRAATPTRVSRPTRPTKTDPTGFTELIQTLDDLPPDFDNVRLDIAAWTTTGMVRTGNEDAFAFLHGVDSRQDELYEYALVLLCDGMGGYDAGEVAAAMAITRCASSSCSSRCSRPSRGKDGSAGPGRRRGYEEDLRAGLRHANKEVFTASRTPGKGKRGMGCTAEAVYVDPRTSSSATSATAASITSSRAGSCS